MTSPEPLSLVPDPPDRDPVSVAPPRPAPTEEPGPSLLRRGLCSAVFMLVGFPLSLFAFIAIVTLFSFGISTLIIWVGLGVLLIATQLVSGLAAVNRALIRGVLRVDIPTPRIELDRNGSFWRRYLNRMLHPQMWRNVLYLMTSFPLHVIGFPLAIAGIILLPIGLFVLPVVAALHIMLAKALIGPNETEQLTQKAEHLQASRARGVDAAEAERRRIERDLHDGAQQRLLSVAMDLGRARAKIGVDLEGARQLIELAHSGTKEAIVELRNLARGIYPAILTDRGLDAALSALAGRAQVPVDVEVDLPGARPPAAVESIAYFVVAESLTNVAKYARATHVSVRVTRDSNWIIVEISDNGIGGAMAAPGGGLAGLADRAAGIDGILTVNSPPGGPTVIRADLPCAW